ncbi:MAG TPA: sigma-70 family RNA polymerase sigma factor [Tepidisphaeraceae bacterium]|jgi:RNA polymerase sigma-70 factor (ECF subfamily)|nr:sigma-70 family RNA polymerase sigma factor [Tepidisphaeraceae bacterium]
MTAQSFENTGEPQIVSTSGADDETKLVALLQSGDNQAFETLVRTYGGRMLTVARRFLPVEQDGDDAVQEAFISAFQNIGTFESHARLWTWLYRILVNACLMKIRSTKRSRTVSIEESLPQFDETGHHAHHPRAWPDDAFSQVAQAETRAQVRQCIEMLPEAYRTVLILRDIEQRDTDETAGILGCTRANVKTRLHRARQALRTILEPMVVSN